MKKSPKTLFGEYFRNRITKRGGMPKGEAFEDFVAECSEAWENEPCDEYGGMTPREYFASVTDVRALADMLEADIKEGGEPTALISGRLTELPGAVSVLTELAENGTEEVRMAAADILWQSDKVPVEAFADMVFDPDTPELFRERLIEILSETDGIYPALSHRMEQATHDGALILGELLVSSGEMNDDVYDFLLSLTSDPETLPRALQLIASYGDMRAIPSLKALAKDCDYATYTDIRSAVEALGGDMDVERDWKGDATYARIKGKTE